MPQITLASLLQRTKAYLQNSSYISDDEIITEIQLFMDIQLPYYHTLNIFQGLWTFATVPHQHIYQMPLDRYTAIGEFMTIDGLREEIQFSDRLFYNVNIDGTFREDNQVTAGDGGNDYASSLSHSPILKGYRTVDKHVYPQVFFSATDSQGRFAQCSDDGTGTLSGTFVNGTIDYITGAFTLNFNASIEAGAPISAKYVTYQPGRPYKALFRGDGGLLELRNVPDKEYVVEIEATIKPSSLINELDILQYNWLFDFVALGAARRIFDRLINTEMLDRTEKKFNEFKYLVQNRSTIQL